jgi:hypothetical protein
LKKLLRVGICLTTLAGLRSKQDKGSMPSNDYPVAGQAALMIAMDTTTDELRAVSNPSGRYPIPRTNSIYL